MDPYQERRHALQRRTAAGLIDILYLGVKLGIYPCLIFICVGAMTEFCWLIANPKSLLLGAAGTARYFHRDPRRAAEQAGHPGP